MTDTYPFDFSAIEKGHVIAIDTIEKAYGTSRDDPGFWKKQLNCKSRLEAYLLQAGIRATICIKQGDICVLTDAQAAEYNRRRFMRGVADAGAAHARNLAVDVTLLEEEGGKDALVAHGRTLHKQGFMLQALHTARKQVSAQPHRHALKDKA